MLTTAIAKRLTCCVSLIILSNAVAVADAKCDGQSTVYEGGMRVPYNVRWPGVTKRNLRSKALVSTIDLLPTFMDAATKKRLQHALKRWQAETRDPLADSEKLRMLMDENDAVVKAKRRSPKDGWQYLKYRTQTLPAIPFADLDDVVEAANEQKRPNVVFILVDDLGWSDLGYAGSKVHETPHVDQLAQQGMILTDFYAAGPVCSPTRASIMTGKYPARTGITTYLLSSARDAKHVQSHLPLEELTIAEAFKKNRFATGYFGKWHLGYENEFWAGKQGFDVAKGGIDLPWAWTLCYPDIKEAPTANTWPKTHTRFFSPYHLTHLENGPKGEYLTERLTNETIAFIEEHRNEPFFAFLSFHTVHTPLQAKPETIEKYRQKIAALGLAEKKEKNQREKAFQNNPAYAAMVQHMDENVGRLLTRLDELKLRDNTIVVWTSDNGGKGSVTSNLPLRGMKHNLYEGGIRVPTIVRWPKRIAAGSKNATPLISNDFYPTLLELTGCPTEPQQHVDGVSFANVLLGKRETVERDAIYWHYPHSRQEAAVREGRFKLLYRFKQDRAELYDLQSDIRERTDLSGKKPEVAQRLLGKLKSWQESVNARFAGEEVQRDSAKTSGTAKRSKRSELEGHDLTPLRKTPQAQWPHPPPLHYQPGNHGARTERWRYTRYRTGEEELYDHDTDPNEWHNLAGNNAQSAIRTHLAEFLVELSRPEN